MSYDRVLQVSTDEANCLIEIYNSEGIVSPTSLNHNLFTTGNRDNISILYLFQQYGTAISIIQHMAHDNQGVPRIHQNNASHQRSKIMMSLPETYTNVPPISIPQNVIRSPTSESQAILRTINIDEDEMQRC